eukprot:4107128-Prymnesium_polylepis.1
MAATQALLSAALRHDLPTVQRAIADAPAHGALSVDHEGHTVAHALLSGLRVHKAGEISRAVRWRSTNLTLYRYDVVQTMVASAHSTFEALLTRLPAIAHAVDQQGITPLHIAAAEGAEGFVELLLRAGASPTAVSLVRARAERPCLGHWRRRPTAMPCAEHAGRVRFALQAGRTPFDDAAQAGHSEVVGMMLEALRRSGSGHSGVERKLRLFAAQPGAALHPEVRSRRGVRSAKTSPAAAPACAGDMARQSAFVPCRTHAGPAGVRCSRARSPRRVAPAAQRNARAHGRRALRGGRWLGRGASRRVAAALRHRQRRAGHHRRRVFAALPRPAAASYRAGCSRPCRALHVLARGVNARGARQPAHGEDGVWSDSIPGAHRAEGHAATRSNS